MLDISYIRQNPEEVKEMLRQRQQSDDLPKVDRLLERDAERKAMVQRTDDLKALRNRVSKEIANIKRTGQGSGEKLISQMKSVSNQISDLDLGLSTLEDEIEELLLNLPNKLHESVPEGTSAEENLLYKGPISFEHDLDFPIKDHLELGKSLGLFDFERGAKITGAGFPVYTGKGARLERALINFMLDTHSANHGYTEVFPPFMVNKESLRGTGQWPKFADQVYHMPEDGLYAIPTAEVPV
ncbi:MAG TPA: serine--tRNA ligase, partial [Chlorobaculum parvum]|nr:serine--tRNA ligase [Chlorobaculum parvum]